jgi:hypothetical protein
LPDARCRTLASSRPTVFARDVTIERIPDINVPVRLSGHKNRGCDENAGETLRRAKRTETSGCACGTGGMLTVAEETLESIAQKRKLQITSYLSDGRMSWRELAYSKGACRRSTRRLLVSHQQKMAAPAVVQETKKFREASAAAVGKRAGCSKMTTDAQSTEPSSKVAENHRILSKLWKRREPNPSGRCEGRCASHFPNWAPSTGQAWRKQHFRRPE